MSTYRADPLDPTSDEIVTSWDEAQAAYDEGARPDPDGLAAGDAWDVLLREVEEYRQDLAFGIVLTAVDLLREMGTAKSLSDAA